LPAILEAAADDRRATAGPAEWVQTCSDWDEWDKPGPPFQVFGNTWYVGTCGIAAILVTGEAGHILIDGGTEAGGVLIAANIEQLGFRVEDIKILLQSHEHFDHVAGLAELQRRSGARLFASPEAAPVMASGVTSADDPQFGMHDPFPPARVDAVLQEDLEVRLGSLQLRAVATPGHTPGALSWQWQSCEGTHCEYIVYADSLSPISSESYRFSDHLEYLAAYRSGLERLAGLDCSILLTPHPSAGATRQRLLSADGLPDATACSDYAMAVLRRLETRLAEEAAE